MISKLVVRIALVLSILTLAVVAAQAADGSKTISTSQDGRMITATPAPAEVTPWVEPDSGLTVIAGNLSKYPYGIYFCCYGYTISGADSFLGQDYWDAIPFTPTTNLTVYALEASVSWGGSSNSGPNGLTLSLNADANGLPGKALASVNLTGLQDYGDCCLLATAKDPAGVPVTAGVQYWLVVSTSASTASTYDGWAFNSTDMRDYHFATYSSDSGWVSVTGLLPGYAVLGK